MDSANNVPAIVIALGTLSIIMGILEIMKANRARKGWRSVRGTVTSSGVVSHKRYDSKENRTATSYEPVVHYQYSVDGNTYPGDRIGFGSGSYSKSKAEQIAGGYKQEAQVTVYYDPAHPDKAVLETKSKGGTTYVLLGLAMLAMGYYILYR